MSLIEIFLSSLVGVNLATDWGELKIDTLQLIHRYEISVIKFIQFLAMFIECLATTSLADIKTSEVITEWEWEQWWCSYRESWPVGIHSICCVFVIAAEYNWEVDTWQTKYLHQTTRQVGFWSRAQQLQYCSLSSKCQAGTMQRLCKEHDLRMWCLHMIILILT